MVFLDLLDFSGFQVSTRSELKAYTLLKLIIIGEVISGGEVSLMVNVISGRFCAVEKGGRFAFDDFHCAIRVKGTMDCDSFSFGSWEDRYPMENPAAFACCVRFSASIFAFCKDRRLSSWTNLEEPSRVLYSRPGTRWRVVSSQIFSYLSQKNMKCFMVD